MKIFNYLCKEVSLTMIAVSAILVFIFLCNMFVHYLDYVATGKYAAAVLFRLIFLQVPILFSLLLPLGLFLGILAAYGRLYAESELTVMHACGFSFKQLFCDTMILALIVMLVVGALVIVFNPALYDARDRLMEEAQSSTVLDTIMPGQFLSSMNGDAVFYIESLSRDRHKMNHVFMAQSEKPSENSAGKNSAEAQQHDNWVIVSARRAHQIVDHQTGDQFIEAQDGYRYQGIPGQRNFQVMRFNTYAKRIGTLERPFVNERGVEAMSTLDLLKTAFHDHEAMAEIQWRISMPLSVLILAILALPLSRVNPRAGRFAKFLPAILIYILYANMMFVTRNWLEDGHIPAWLGLFWVHALVLLLGIFLIIRQIRQKR